ncbi:MAG: aminotransferase class III-fold pyridoxal phosphate-dependent enzyme [Chitinispirillaceae bacterium]|nr:aminotransferase class III-fold pyridoxal phosphate-dependent enzyme [Chitinispirillaceae bacterium]
MDLIRSHLGIHSITMSSLQCQSIVFHLQKALMSQGVCSGDRLLIEADSTQSELYSLLLTTAAASMGVGVVLPMCPLGRDLLSWAEQLKVSHIFLPWIPEEYTTESSFVQGITPKLLLNDSPLHWILNHQNTSVDDSLSLIPESTKDSEDLFLSTSGSEGKPKFISYSWNAFWRSARSWDQGGLFNKNALGGAGFTLLFAHSMGIRAWVNALYIKAPLCLIDPQLILQEPSLAAEFLGAMKPAHLTGGPALFGTLLELCKQDPALKNTLAKHLRTLVLSGAPYHKGIAEKCSKAFNLPVHNAFGTTETLQVLSTVHQKRTYPDSLGKPLPGVELVLTPMGESLFKMGIQSPFGGQFIYSYLKPKKALGSIFWSEDIIEKKENGELVHIKRSSSDFFKDAFGVKIDKEAFDSYFMSSNDAVYGLEGILDSPGLLLWVVRESWTKEEVENWKTQALLLNQKNKAERDLASQKHYRILRVFCVSHLIPPTRKGSVAKQVLKDQIKDLVSEALFLSRRPENVYELNESLSDPLLDQLHPRMVHFLKALHMDKPLLKAEKDWVWTPDEEPYLDCIGGFGSTLLGHQPEELIETAINYLQKGSPCIADQTSFQMPAAKLSEALQDWLLAETGRLYQIFLASGGAEAIDLSLRHVLLQWKKSWKSRRQQELKKAAVWAPDLSESLLEEWRLFEKDLVPEVILLQGAFHGNMLSGLSLSGQSHRRSFLGEMVRIHPHFIDPLDLNAASILEEVVKKAVVKYPALVKQAGHWEITKQERSNLLAAYAEPVMGEGGIKVVPESLLQAMSGLPCPFVIDAVQCGLGRTGYLTGTKVPGHLVVFSKALGAGIEKIAACAIERRLLQKDFYKASTNTFGNGGLAASIALKNIEILRRLPVGSKSIEVGHSICKCLTDFQKAFPRWVKGVHGKGLLWGIEFNFEEEEGCDFFIRFLNSARLTGYLLAGYLFHRFHIRIFPSLSAHHVLRIEPSLHFGEKELAHLKKGLWALGALLNSKDWYELCRPLVFDDPWARSQPMPSPKKQCLDCEIPLKEAKRIGFLVHYLHGVEEMRTAIPAFSKFSDTALKMFFSKLMPIAEERPVTLFSKNIHQGKLWMKTLLLPVDVATMENARGRRERHRLLEKLQSMIDSLYAEGCRWISLGAYTSIISDNGLDLHCPSDAVILTGNTMTAALALQQTTPIQEKKIAVIGAGGNIGSCLTECLLELSPPEASFLLIGQTQAHLTRVWRSIPKEKQAQVRITTAIEEVAQNDLILCAANSSSPILFPGHLQKQKKYRLLDLSVPGAVSESVRQCANVEWISNHAGLALPLDPDLQFSPMLPEGYAYACAIEAMICALDGDLSWQKQLKGRLQASHVQKIKSLACKYGFFENLISIHHYQA